MSPLDKLKKLLVEQADPNGLVKPSPEFDAEALRLFGDSESMRRATAALKDEGFYVKTEYGLQLKQPGRSTRRPASQNEHFWCILNIRGLTAVERIVAVYLHGLCYVDGGEREATKEYLSYKSEVSQRSVAAATKKLVSLGLFDRLDNGKGGRNKQNRARYRPMVPGWWTGNP